MNNIWGYIEKLRQKPEQEKKAVALFVSFGITAVIAITWVTMLFSSFSNSEEEEKNKSQTASPFQAMGSQLESFRDQLGEIKDIFKNEIEVEK